MYKVFARKNGELLDVVRLETNERGEIYCVWYRFGDSSRWIFTVDLDEFEIKKEIK